LPLVDQREVFEPVASTSTCWRMLDAIGRRELEVIAAARLDGGGHYRCSTVTAGPCW